MSTTVNVKATLTPATGGGLLSLSFLSTSQVPKVVDPKTGEEITPEILSDNTIVVPKGLGSVTVNLQVETTAEVKAIRAWSNTGQSLTSSFQSVISTAPFKAMLGTPSPDGSYKLVVLQDTNGTPATWSFGLMVGGNWYDPQIQNDGET